MKTDGIANSLAQVNLEVVLETIADAYALMRSISPTDVRKHDEALDCSYVHRRHQSEGLTFLTVTLPRLGDFLDRFVNGDTIERVEGFAPYNGLYPVFLRPFWIFLGKFLRDPTLDYLERPYSTDLPGALQRDLCLVWPIDLGQIDPRIYQLVRILRTLLHGMKKLNVPSTAEQISERLASFLLIEEEMCVSSRIGPTPVLWYAQFLMERFMRRYKPVCLNPRHGPGSVAGGERGNGKWKFSTLYESLHSQFPYYDIMFGVRSCAYDTHTGSVRTRPFQLAYSLASYRSMRRESEPTAKLFFVPKDSRGPRVISCEPKELMYVQQGVAGHLMKFIERHSYTRGHVNFIDQSINGNLALEASASKAWATIDLSDASDRVSCELVRFLVPERVSKKWLALRSTATLLPSGQTVRLEKFAPMGSAMCFPVESLIFWALAVACVWERTRDLSLALAAVYVYGDDIIVKDEFCVPVMETLEAVGLKVNESKSFHGHHPFRESCGVEALNGHNVTPLRIRKMPPQRPSDGTGIEAYVDYASNSASLCPRRSQRLLKHVEGLVGRIPRTPIPQAFVSVVDPANFWSQSDYKRLVWDPSACYYRTRAIVLKTPSREDPIDSWSRLQHDLVTGRVDADPSLVVDRSSTQICSKWCHVTYLELETEGG